MSTTQSRRFPATVTHLSLTRCQICRRTVAYRHGTLSQALTEHCRRAHPEALSLPAVTVARRNPAPSLAGLRRRQPWAEPKIPKATRRHPILAARTKDAVQLGSGKRRLPPVQPRRTACLA
jgi:hypothetical protein